MAWLSRFAARTHCSQAPPAIYTVLYRTHACMRQIAAAFSRRVGLLTTARLYRDLTFATPHSCLHLPSRKLRPQTSTPDAGYRSFRVLWLEFRARAIAIRVRVKIIRVRIRVGVRG